MQSLDHQGQTFDQVFLLAGHALLAATATFAIRWIVINLNGNAGLFPQLQVVCEDVKGVVFIIWVKHFLFSLLQVAFVFRQDAHRGANNEEGVVEGDLHRACVL